MIRIFLKNKSLSSGKKPVMLSVTKKGKRKVFSLGISCNENEWNKRTKTIRNTHPESVQYNEVIRKNKSNADLIISEFQLLNIDFTLDEFEKKFRDIGTEYIYFYDYFQKNIIALESSGKQGTSETLKTTLSSLKKFMKTSPLLEQIDFDFLMNYEQFLRINGNTDGGIAFKMRTIRRVLKIAAESDLIEFKNYPFKKFKISKLKSSSRKIALSLNELRKFENADLSFNTELHETQMLFMFSFYCRGLNWSDMISMKWEQIKDDKIFYVRRKTGKKFIIEVLPPVVSILEYFKKMKTSSSAYVFNVLPEEEMTSAKFKYHKHRTLKLFNGRLSIIAKKTDIDKKITSYVARHSFATIMKFKKVPVDVICELMGHSNVNVTMSYLKDFEDETLDKYARNLLKEANPVYRKIA